MKNMKSIIYLLFLAPLFLGSCKEKQALTEEQKIEQRRKTLVKSTGGVREIIAVIDDALYTNSVQEIVNYFLGDMYALPQAEPEMKVHDVPRSRFSHMYQMHRNLLMIRKTESTPSIVFDQDYYAKPQFLIEVKVQNASQLDSILKANKTKILETYQNGDVVFLQKKFEKIQLAESKTEYFKDFGAKVTIPNFYKVGSRGDNFIWLYKDIKKGMHRGTVNILLYKIPMTDVVSPLTIRNEITKMYVGGHYEDSYQVIDFVNLLPKEKTTELDGKFAFRSKGLWRMEGKDIMGGPFINYTVYDDVNETVWGVDGFVFYPSQDKAQYMVEIEAILRTFKVIQ